QAEEKVLSAAKSDHTSDENQLLLAAVSDRLQTIHPTLRRKFVAQIQREIAQSFQDEEELHSNREEYSGHNLKNKKRKYERNEIEKKTNNNDNSKIVSPEPVENSEEQMVVD